MKTKEVKRRLEEIEKLLKEDEEFREISSKITNGALCDWIIANRKEIANRFWNIPYRDVEKGGFVKASLLYAPLFGGGRDKTAGKR